MPKSSKQEHILITGGEGMVAGQFNFGVRLGRKQLDILDRSSIRNALLRFKPKVVVHCAAMTDMLECQNRPADAYQINVTGTRNVAELARRHGIFLVYLSSGAVFGGIPQSAYGERDIPAPLNFYGMSKLMGEYAVSTTAKEYAIVRTGWLFGGGPALDKKFVARCFETLKNKRPFRATGDRYGSPTYIPDLGEVIRKISAKKQTGLFHAANGGRASYFDVATFIRDICKYSSPVTSVPATEVENQILLRPKSEVLISRTIKMRPWKAALKEYLNEFKISS